MNRIAVVIVNYNGGEFIRACLSALVDQTVKADRVVVLDNASTDGSENIVREFTSSVDLIELHENTGFAKANNIAINRLDGYEWLALLNPDAIPASDWIEQLHRAIADYPECSSFACCMLQMSSTHLIDGCGDAYHINGIAWPRFKGLSLEQVDNTPQEIFSACAGAAMYKRSVVSALGGFDERYFCYHEDVDLGFRLRLANERCMYIPNAIVYHAGSAIAGKGSDFSVYHAHRNMVWTFVKNMPQPLLAIAFVPHVIVNIITIINFIAKRRSAIILKAKVDAIKGIPSILRTRRQMQSSMSVSRSMLLRHMQYGKFLGFVLKLTKASGYDRAM